MRGQHPFHTVKLALPQSSRSPQSLQAHSWWLRQPLGRSATQFSTSSALHLDFSIDLLPDSTSPVQKTDSPRSHICDFNSLAVLGSRPVVSLLFSATGQAFPNHRKYAARCGFQQAQCLYLWQHKMQSLPIPRPFFVWRTDHFRHHCCHLRTAARLSRRYRKISPLSDLRTSMTIWSRTSANFILTR